MLINILFFILFSSQIFLLSYYFPRKIVERIEQVISQYPPAQYPRLYPKSLDATRLGINIYKLINWVILLIGGGLLLLQGVEFNMYGSEGNIWEGMPLMYGLLQCISYLLLEVSGHRQFKLMRQSDKRKIRSAQLQPRRLFDFISPLLTFSAALLVVIAIVANLYLPHFTLSFDVDALVIVGAILLANAVIGLSLYKNVYGAKQDPYQADQDRLKQTKAACRSGVSVSIVASIYMIGQVVSETYQMPALEIIFNSIYFQLIAILATGTLLNTMKLEDMNFEGYKDQKLN